MGGSQALLGSTHHTWSRLSRESVTVPPGWVRLWQNRSPRMEGVSSAYPTRHPGERGLGASSAPPGVAGNWAGPGCSCRGPGRRESKAAMWALLSSLASKRCKQTLAVPGGSSLLGAPACALPPFCSFLESRQRPGPRGTPEGPRLMAVQEERGLSAKLREERGGGGVLTLMLVPTMGQAGSWKLTRPSPSHLSRTFQS